MKRILLFLAISGLLVGCQAPKKPVKVPAGTGNQQASIGKSADNIDKSASTIKDTARSIGRQLPDSSEPQVIEDEASKIQVEAGKLRTVNDSLKEKDELVTKQQEADQTRIGDLEMELEDAQSQGAWLYTVLYVAMIACGVAGMAAGIGLIFFGFPTKVGFGVAGTSLVVMVAGITIPTYGCYIGMAGAVIAIVAMVWGGILVRKRWLDQTAQAEKDEKMKVHLVRATQVAIENDPVQALKILSTLSCDETKDEIRRIKRKDQLGKFQPVSDTLEAAEPAATETPAPVKK